MNPRVYFFVQLQRPVRVFSAGGPKVALQHVDILRRNGIDASLVYRHRTSSDPAFISEREFRRNLQPDRDVVVVPGRLAPRLNDIPGRIKVLFSQSSVYNLAAFGTKRNEPYPWHDGTLRAIICVSEHNAAIIRLSLPDCPVYTVSNRVDCERFHFVPFAEKRRLVALNSMDRAPKNPIHMQMLLNVLRSRAARSGSGLDMFDVAVIQGLSPEQVAQTLAAARCLLFLSPDEGFGLLPLEAMCAGTVVIAYDLAPMNEFLPPQYVRPWGDIAGLVELVESVCSTDANEKQWDRLTRLARVTSERYSLEAQEQSVLRVYEGIMREVSSRPT